MKQKWFVSCIGAVTLALAAIAFTGCTGAAADGQTRLQFNEAALSAVNTATGKSIASGDVVADNTEVKFSAKLSRDNGTVAKWYIGKRSVTPLWAGYEVWHTINTAKEGNRYKVINVSYDLRDKKEVAISFDADKIVCYKWNDKKHSFTDEVISGTKLMEGTRIEFRVKDSDELFANKKMVRFSLSGKPLWGWNTGYDQVEVHSEYAKDDTITITCEVRDAKKFKVTFDSTKIKCEKKDREELSTGADVYEYYDNGLKFSTKDNKLVTWKVGKKTIEGGKQKEIIIDPDSKYLDNNSEDTITVTYTD